MEADRIARREVRIGGLTRGSLISALTSRGVLLNAHAEVLLEHPDFDDPSASTIEVTDRSVADLGFPEGATLLELLRAAPDHGLLPCPTITAPYLRLAMDEQMTSPDSVMSAGRAPSGSLTVATKTLNPDHEYPKGFYLRVVDGRAWLRGYRCDDQHVWSPTDRFVFRLHESADVPGVQPL